MTYSWPDLLICDLDGTLVDSVSGITRTTRAVLLAAGQRVPEEAEVHPLIGLPLADVFATLLSSPASPDLIERLVGSYRDVYARLIIPATRPYDGVLATLERYRSAGGRVAVATSKIESVARAAISAAGLADHVSILVAHDSVTHPKPCPDMVLLCLEVAGVPRDRALVVGDTTFDIQMARDAGVAACGVSYGVHGRAVLLEAGAARVVDRFADVLDDGTKVVSG